MARSRSRRRRQNTLIVVALAVTVAFIVLVHDVRRLSAQNAANRVSLNRTFGSLATAVMIDENRWGSGVSTLLATAPTMTRANFAADLALAEFKGHDIAQRAELLQKPELVHDVQSTFVQVTTDRVRAVTGLLERIGSSLALPTGGYEQVSVSSAHQILTIADARWERARRSLLFEPGHVRLPRSVFAITSASVASEFSAILSSSTLAVHRDAVISAVSVSRNERAKTTLAMKTGVNAMTAATR